MHEHKHGYCIFLRLRPWLFIKQKDACSINSISVLQGWEDGPLAGSEAHPVSISLTVT